MPPLFPVARCWDCCHFSAPHIEGRNGPCRIYWTTRRYLPSFKAIWSPDPRFFLASGASCRQWGWVGWPTCTSRWH